MFLVTLLGYVLGAIPAHAWKPKTHIYAANVAVEPIVAGGSQINIGGKDYNVDPRVAQAIYRFPAYYRGGVVGPDGYPDMFVGQSRIHPDTRSENGTLPEPELGSGHSYTYEWLRHVYEAGWTYYYQHGGDDPAQQVLAFTYGYLTHAAGDMWGHTFVNDFARGVFPSPTEFAYLPIAARHIVVEGYVGFRTPSTGAGDPANRVLAAPLDFVYSTLIASGKDGGFVDSANQDSASLGRGAILEFFFNLKYGLEDRSEALKGLGPLNPLWLIAQPVIAYMDEWVDDIDEGLRAWPGMSHQVAYELFTNENTDAALNTVTSFIGDHVLSMIGIPDPLIAIFDLISDILSVFDPIIEPLAEQAKELRNYMIKQATGIDIVELKEYLTTPENHINSPAIGLDPNTSSVLDGLMATGSDQNQPDKFNNFAFAAIKNTILTSQLILLSADELNRLLYDHRVGPIYSDAAPFSDRANFMLGFIRTLDGHSQWRKTTIRNFPNSPAGIHLSEGLPIWRDCLARDRVFRLLFSDWQNAGFPAAVLVGQVLVDDPAESLSATPPPTSTLSLNGSSVATDGVVFVGGNTKFTVSAVPDHYWNADEVTVFGQFAPGGVPASGSPSITIGPLTGPDGVYTVTYNANGMCLSGPPHSESTKTAKFTLDHTPPTITIGSPPDGLTLDVVQTAPVTFSAVDTGVGLDTVSATLDGVPIADGAVIDAFLLAAGEHHLVVTASDRLGNAASVDRKIYVRASIAGLKAAVTRAYAERLITIPPKDLGVQHVLDAAQASFDKGNVNTTRQQLGAIVQIFSAQLGRGIDPSFGNRYIGWVKELQGRL